MIGIISSLILNRMELFLHMLLASCACKGRYMCCFSGYLILLLNLWKHFERKFNH